MKAKKILPFIIFVIVLITGVYLLAQNSSPKKEVQTVTIPQGKPIFEWSYTYSSRSDIPQSTVHLTARYPNGATTTKQIETIEGNCNEYSERDKDVYPQSQMILCYYAGFGRYYKVVEEGNSYVVKRKEFEEASPDYNPPILPFETIATF